MNILLTYEYNKLGTNNLGHFLSMWDTYNLNEIDVVDG